MGYRTFVKRSRFPVSQADLFAWHQRSDAFELLVPPWQEVTIVERSSDGISEGYTQTMRIATPIGPKDWRAKITRFDPPNEFIDEQLSGPFAYWHHRHQMVAITENESELIDEVTYRLPMGFLGDLLAGWYIRRDLKKLFDYRHKVCRSYFKN